MNTILKLLFSRSTNLFSLILWTLALVSPNFWIGLTLVVFSIIVDQIDYEEANKILKR